MTDLWTTTAWDHLDMRMAVDEADALSSASAQEAGPEVRSIDGQLVVPATGRPVTDDDVRDLREAGRRRYLDG